MAATASEGRAPDGGPPARSAGDRPAPPRPRRARSAARASRLDATAGTGPDPRSSPACPICRPAHRRSPPDWRPGRSIGGERRPARPEPACHPADRPGRRARPRLRGFERGCDDYLVKPFSYPELRGRIAAVLRRARRRPLTGRLRIGALEIDPLGRNVELDGRAGPSVKEGVRAAAGARRGSDTGVHARGAAARGVGLQVTRRDANAGLARLRGCAASSGEPAAASSSTCGASAIG